jgi:hypothetical protein
VPQHIRRVLTDHAALQYFVPLLDRNLQHQAQTDYSTAPPGHTCELAGTPTHLAPNPLLIFANHHNPRCQTNTPCLHLHDALLSPPFPPPPSARGLNRTRKHRTAQHIKSQQWQTWTSTSRAATRSLVCSPTASATSWTSSSTQSTTPQGK